MSYSFMQNAGIFYSHICSSRVFSSSSLEIQLIGSANGLLFPEICSDEFFTIGKQDRLQLKIALPSCLCYYMV